MGFALIILFSAAQGTAVFATAWLALRLLKVRGWPWKISAICLSYVAWITLTIAAYTVLGGEGGLMDGFGLVLALCFTALVSSFVYLLVWIFIPLFTAMKTRRRVASHF